MISVASKLNLPPVRLFVLVAQDLHSIQPMEPYYPYGNQWNAYSPFQAIVPLEIHDLTELASLDLITLLVGPQSRGDTPFTQQMQFHQSWYRAHHLGVLYGTGPTEISKRLYGNMLRPEAAKQGLNFLDPLIKDAAEERLQRKDGLVEPFRLRHNLLASQAMCFNLFGLFVHDPAGATPLVRTMLPDAIERVIRVELEYAPMPAKDYLNDRTAFDAFIEYLRPDGRHAFAGIETKLSEPFSGKRYPFERYAKLAQPADSPWPASAWPQLDGVRYNQLWRDHLLVYAMLKHPNAEYVAGRLVLVRHPKDASCATVVDEYRALLRPDEDGFIDRPLDELVDGWRSALPASEASKQAWLDAVEKRYLQLQLSEADWLHWKAHAAK